MLGDRRLCACGLRAARCCEMQEAALSAPGSGRPLTPIVALSVLYQICRDQGAPAAADVQHHAHAAEQTQGQAS
jgi:hypothetical protein